MPGVTVRVRAPELCDWLLAHGRSFVTTEQAAVLLGVPPGQVRTRLHAPVSRGELISPARGFWVPVAPQYRNWGAPPPVEVVDALMAHLARDYYVGWLSASELLGAAHQRPQVFQVAVQASVTDRQIGRSRWEFAVRSEVSQRPRTRRQVPTGYVWVSTPEVTVLDLCDDPLRAGGLSNAATVIGELAEDDLIDVPALARVADQYPAAAGRRAGWVLSLVAPDLELSGLAEVVARRVASPSPLRPDRPERGSIDARWRVRVNADVEPDL
jgi:predicted transcriptional regulator of viral defense system